MSLNWLNGTEHGVEEREGQEATIIGGAETTITVRCRDDINIGHSTYCSLGKLGDNHLIGTDATSGAGSDGSEDCRDLD